jgi:2-polyprenyl-6-methoxyphenol hydroxylase-like FAD-dependent oxidoreductase
VSVAVVGAGVAGAATAIGLAQLGVPVTVFETVAQPQPIGAGLLLQPTGQQVLAHLGLLDSALAHGARLDRLHGDTAGGRTVLNLRYSRFSPDAFGLGLQRGVLMGLLWQRLQALGVPWHCGVTVTGWVESSEGVRLKGEGDADIGVFDAVLLADGSFSRLRAQLAGVGGRVRADPFPWGALWAVLPQPHGFPAIELRQRFRAARQMLGLMPVGRAWGSAPDSTPGINLFWSLPLAEMPDLDRLDLRTWKRPLLELLPWVEPLLDGLKDAHQLRPARYADVRLQPTHRGAVLAIGDAAHGMSPQLGQGANMALIDAQVLAQTRRAHPRAAWPEILARFVKARRAHLRYYGQASRWLTPMFQSHQTVLPALRDAFMAPLGQLPWFHGQNVATLSGMKTGWLWGQLDLSNNPWSPP